MPERCVPSGPQFLLQRPYLSVVPAASHVTLSPAFSPQVPCSLTFLRFPRCLSPPQGEVWQPPALMKTDSSLLHYGVKNKWVCQAGIRSVATGVRLLSPGDQRCDTYRSFHGDSANTSPRIHTLYTTCVGCHKEKRADIHTDRQTGQRDKRWRDTDSRTEMNRK